MVSKLKMEQTTHTLHNGLEIVIREATAEDASSVLYYVQQVCAESDFLTFGPGELEINEIEEKDILKKAKETKNQFTCSD